MNQLPIWLPWVLVWVVLGLFMWAVVHGGSKLGGGDE